MNDAEPKIRIDDREELIYMLAEAAEIEHNVMCCYFYGIWSLKRGERDGLTPKQAETVRAWKTHMTAVAIEEMTHLTLVGNLACAIGAAPHLSRPNFPIPAGNHPGAVDLELFGFSPALVDHAIFLERPEGVAMDDAPEFAHLDDYHRVQPRGRIMPNAQDYASIGHLYRGILHGMEGLSRKLGEEVLFCGEVGDQIGPSEAPLPGLNLVTDLASAREAIETIVEQGEGAPAHTEDSHYQKFLEMRAELDKSLAEDPDFSPAFPVARNPVPNPGPQPDATVWISNPEAARVLDLANSIYNQMLRFLVQGYGRDNKEGAHKRLFVMTARELMWTLTPVCEYLASLPAGPEHPHLNAGMTFTMVRDIARLPPCPGELRILRERLEEIAAQAARLFPAGHELDHVSGAIAKLAARIDVPGSAAVPTEKAAKPKSDKRKRAHPVGRAEGKDLVLSFDTGKCIHARFCVLGAPEVFLSGVKGQWLFPDSMATEDLRGICHDCPSGAVSYEPRRATPPEPAPQVNTLHLRENGPYAFRAPMRLGDEEVGFRATLCRCGASRNKPFCDGSHVDIGFQATGEPDSRKPEPLDARDGALTVEPLRNGPLQVSGNLEICAGTGRAIDRVTSVRLCRCGGSATKPFCDNTHLKIGFQSD